MAKFKVGDRVRLVDVRWATGGYLLRRGKRSGDLATVYRVEEDILWVKFDKDKDFYRDGLFERRFDLASESSEPPVLGTGIENPCKEIPKAEDRPVIKNKHQNFRACAICKTGRTSALFLTVDLKDYPICGTCGENYVKASRIGTLTLKVGECFCSWCKKSGRFPTHQFYKIGDFKFDMCSICWNAFRVRFFRSLQRR